MQEKRVASFYATIWIAGDAAEAERICRRYCMDVGLCVTVTPTRFIYTGAAEDGVCVRLVNYPRFPVDPDNIRFMADNLADALRNGLSQWSVMIETPVETIWRTTRPESGKES